MIRRTTLVATLAAACAVGFFTASYAAADNDAVVILDRQQQSTPLGSYDRRHETRVFGPGSGYRYEEYSERAPGVIVYPYAGYHRGHARPGYRHRRTIESYGRGAYGFAGTHVAPAAPRGPGIIGGHAYGRGDYSGRPARPEIGRNAQRRAIAPAQRALPRAQRAIRP